MVKKTSAGHQETTYNSATFLVELRTCFQIEISNDTANLVNLQKKIPYKCMVKLSQYMYMQGKHDLIGLIIYAHTQIHARTCISGSHTCVHSWIHLKQARTPGHHKASREVLCFFI